MSAIAGEILLRAARPDSALTLYTRYVEDPTFHRLHNDGLFLPVALERLAQLHDDRGNAAEAIDYYARFVELWEQVDPPGRPRVEAAKRRVAALTGEGS